MGYRSPTIHSSVLKMAGSPKLRAINGKLPKTDGESNGYSTPCNRDSYHQCNNRGCANPLIQPRRMTTEGH
jgi:hypothetical protein